MKTHHYVQSEKCNLKCTYCNVDTLNKHKHTYDDFLGYYHTYIKPNDEPYNFDIFGESMGRYRMMDISNFYVNVFFVALIFSRFLLQ